MKKVIQIPGAPKPVGPYSQAILVKETLYVSGQIPINPTTGKLISGSISDLTHQVMNNISALLQEAGMDFNNVVKCGIFLTDMDDFAEVNSAYAEYFDELPPARETVQVAKLPLNTSIEISCIATV